MGTPGPRPKPTILKQLAGNPGKRGLNHDAPTFPPAVNPRAPRSPSLNPEARRLFHVLGKALGDAGLLTVADVPALQMLCIHWGLVCMADAQIREDGGVLITSPSTGEIKKNPAATVLAENSRALRSYLIEFGLTPSSRVRLKGAGGEQDVSLADLLFSTIDGPEEKAE